MVNLKLTIENSNYNHIKGLLESAIFLSGNDIDKTLKSLEKDLVSTKWDEVLKTGRGGTHIWISLRHNNQRIAIIN